MNDAQTRIGAVLLAALVAVALMLRFGPDPSGDDNPEATAPVWSVEEAKVVRVEVVRASGRLVVERDGEKWKVLEPFDYPADTRVVEALVSELSAIDKGVPMDGDKADFGLADPPLAEVTLTLEGGETRQLKVGHPATVTRKLYVQAADGGIAAVESDVHELLIEDAESYRDLRIWSFEPSEVQSVVLDSAEGTLEVSRDPSNRWWLRGYGRADADRVEDLVVGLLNIRLQRWHSPAEIFIDKVEHTAVVTLKDGQQFRMEVGVSTGVISLVRVEGGAASGPVNSEELALLGQGPADIGESRAFPLDTTAITGLSVELPDGRWSLQKKGDIWERDGKEELKAQAALEAVARVGIEYPIEPPPAWSETVGKIVVQEGDAQSVWEVGGLVDDRWRLVRDTAGGDPYRVQMAAFGPIAAPF